MWRGDYATYNVEVVTAIAEGIWSSWIPIAFIPPSLVGSGRCSNVAVTPKTSSKKKIEGQILQSLRP